MVQIFLVIFFDISRAIQNIANMTFWQVAASRGKISYLVLIPLKIHVIQFYIPAKFYCFTPNINKSTGVLILCATHCMCNLSCYLKILFPRLNHTSQCSLITELISPVKKVFLEHHYKFSFMYTKSLPDLLLLPQPIVAR